jgi:hypothetical protein
LIGGADFEGELKGSPFFYLKLFGILFAISNSLTTHGRKKVDGMRE